MQRTFSSSDRAGFTLLEMLLVVVILAMMAGILVPVLERELIVAADSRRASDLKTVQSAVPDDRVPRGEVESRHRDVDQQEDCQDDSEGNQSAVSGTARIGD